MSRRARAAAAALGLAVLLGGVAVPLLGLVLAEEPADFCCSTGRCCCTGETTDDGGGRPCLRVRCGCGRPDAAVIAAPLRLEAVLPAVAAPSGAEARRLDGHLAPASPLERREKPPLPPPKPPLPA
jgi:hypothetical protein